MEASSRRTSAVGRNFPRRRGQRAGIACQECSRRKVRCDVELSLLPCTNCKLDEVQCTVRTGKRDPLARRRMIRNIVQNSHRTTCQDSGSTDVSTEQVNELESPTLLSTPYSPSLFDEVIIERGEYLPSLFQSSKSCTENSESPCESSLPRKEDIGCHYAEWNLPQYIMGLRDI
jgi:Fungal Zn(2)-Cys(6) binuclear cluster domain.